MSSNLQENMSAGMDTPRSNVIGCDKGQERATQTSSEPTRAGTNSCATSSEAHHIKESKIIGTLRVADSHRGSVHSCLGEAGTDAEACCIRGMHRRSHYNRPGAIIRTVHGFEKKGTTGITSYVQVHVPAWSSTISEPPVQQAIEHVTSQT